MIRKPKEATQKLRFQQAISGDFNAVDWAKKINETKTELKLKQIDLDIAKETVEEYFGNEKV